MYLKIAKRIIDDFYFKLKTKNIKVKIKIKFEDNDKIIKVSTNNDKYSFIILCKDSQICVIKNFLKKNKNDYLLLSDIFNFDIETEIPTIKTYKIGKFNDMLFDAENTPTLYDRPTFQLQFFIAFFMEFYNINNVKFLKKYSDYYKNLLHEYKCDFLEKIKKVMISQPMKGLSENEIIETKQKAIEYLQSKNFEVIDTYFNENDLPKQIKNIDIGFLSLSILSMSKCDAVYFCKGWQNSIGCKIERKIAKYYGIEILDEI